MRKMKSLLVVLLIIASLGNVIKIGKAQGSLPPLWGYITDSHGNDLPEGVPVIIRDLTKSTQTTTYTIFNSETGRTSYYQLNSLDEVPNCEDGDLIEVYCSYNGEDNSVVFKLENSSSIVSIEKSFSLIAPPSVTTLDASDITSYSAKLNGELIDLGGDSSCKVWFEYGKTTAYGYSTAKQTKYSPASISASISGLQPDTTYHFRIVAQNSRKISYGNDLTFHTPPALPEVATQPASNIGYDSATLNGYLSKVGASSCEVWFVYDVVFHENWEDYAYSTSHFVKTSPSSFSYTITGLQLNVEYHFRAVAGNAAGTVAGDDVAFTTHIVLPSVITLDALNISSDAAMLRANLTDLGGDESCKVWFEYGETTSYGYSTEIKEINKTGIVEIEAGNLQPCTIYHFRVVAQNSKGISYGYDKSFETLAVKASGETKEMEFAVILKGNLTDMGGDDECYVYFEYWEEGGEKKQTPKKIMSDEGEFSEVISDLKENTTYYYRAVVENSQGISYGTNLSFKTLALPSPPVVESLAAVPFQNNATLYANVSDMGESSFCYLWFEYWNGEKKSTEVITVNSTGVYGIEVNNLDDGVKYYYRAVAVGSNGRISYGRVRNFTTQMGENHLPEVSIISPENDSVVGVETSLTVNVFDADGDLMRVEFFWQNGSKIYEVETYSGMVSIAISLKHGKNYGWYVNVSDGISFNVTPIYHFRTMEEVVANFTHSFIFAGEMAYFNESCSGNITQWIWNFGDGNVAYGKNVSHIYASHGSFIVNLTVIDVYGNKFYVEKEVEVWERGDANMDGRINALDIAMIKRIIDGMESSDAHPPADANRDGMVSHEDLQVVVEKILGLT